MFFWHRGWFYSNAPDSTWLERRATQSQLIHISLFYKVSPGKVFWSTKISPLQLLKQLWCITINHCWPGSSVGIATDYGAGRSGDRIPVGSRLSARPDRPWGPRSLLYNGHRVFPGGKVRPGRDADPSPTSSAVGHERVELYLYTPYGPYGLYRASVTVQGCTLR